jgi:hypothetical protein
VAAKSCDWYAPSGPKLSQGKAMQYCEIYHFPYKDSFVWKWRHTGEHGRVTESKESYPLFYECVCAARKSGYEPKIKRHDGELIQLARQP